MESATAATAEAALVWRALIVPALRHGGTNCEGFRYFAEPRATVPSHLMTEFVAGVRVLGSVVVPADETCFFLYAEDP
jgi:hypothetical protein